VTAERAKPRVERQPRVQQAHSRQTPAAQTAPPKRATSDIPLDQVEAIYTPMQSGSKTGFRDDGRDRQSDQEFGNGIPIERFGEEDVFTNKTGDPHIGTHRRTNEPDARERDEVR
jgi:hypothetical protein